MKLHRIIPLAATVRSSVASGRFLSDFMTFQKLRRTRRAGNQRIDQPMRWSDRNPCLEDRTSTTPFDRHYIYHTAWAARILAQTKPNHHIDIASSLYFVSNVSAFVPMTFYDYRPAELRLDNLDVDSADLLDLPFDNRSVSSLSCMHVVEHVGLGRYGDPLDPDGDKKAMTQLQRVIATGGSLLFVTPVGRSRICYNAHRVYSFEQVIGQFSELQLEQFALIPDDGTDRDLLVGASPDLVAKQEYGCGCFWFRRAA